MNLLPLAAGHGGAVVAGTEGPVVAPAECAGMTLGVRPEHIALTVERGARAVVSAIEYLGADSLVACRLGASIVAARVPGSVGLRAGDAAWLAWPGGAQHLFDAGGARQGTPSPQPSATLYA